MKVAALLIGQSNEKGNCKLYLDGVSTGGACATKRAEYGFPNESELSFGLMLQNYCGRQTRRISGYLMKPLFLERLLLMIGAEQPQPPPIIKTM